MRGLVRIVHPFPSLLVTAVTLALVPLADRSAGVGLYLMLGLGMLAYQFAIGAANDVVDVADDRAANRPKPLVRGDLAPRSATRLAVLFAGAGMVVTLGLDPGPWAIGLAGLACGLIYDAWLKRTALSWLPMSVAFPLVPVWVFSAAGAWHALLWWAFPLGILLGASVHLANQIPDVAAEAGRVRGAAHRLDVQAAFRLAMGCFGAAASTATVVLAFVSQERALLAAIAGVVALLTAPRAARLFGRNGLFGVLAVSSAVLALVFLSAV